MGIFDKFKRRRDTGTPAEPERAPAAAGGDAPLVGHDPAAADHDQPVDAAGATPGVGATPAAGQQSGDSQALADLREQIELWMRPGFRDRGEVTQYAREFRDDDQLPVDDQQLAQLVDEVWRARLDEQRRWPDPTDADKVAAAFDELDATGVVARMNFTCCQTCGVAEIDDERPADRPSAGYVFFHQQDSDGLADDPAYLYLAYGTFDPEQGRGAEQDEEIGRRVQQALEARGLPVEWNGSSTQRIRVGPLAWQRRLPA